MARSLHLRCGSDIKDGLISAGIGGDFRAWGDPVCQGPAPSEVPPSAYRRARIEFITTFWGASEADVEGRLYDDEDALEELDQYDEITLWFEHDLYDQCILIQLLAALGTRPELWPRLRLICIDSFPGIARFVGLGQLGPDQLASVYPTARPITEGQLGLGHDVWHAYREPTPRDLLGYLDPAACEGLPHLVGALRRHFQEYPSTASGLGLTEQLCLEAIEGGIDTAVAVFAALMSELDPQPFLGDSMFWPHLESLAGGERPAITMRGGFPDQPLALTEFGRALVEGEGDWVAENGLPPGSLNRWRGGVELRPEVGDLHRWDSASGRLLV